MRIHTNTLRSRDLYVAASLAGVMIETADEHGSRSRHHAFDVTLSGNGRTGNRYGNSGTSGRSDVKAATWDEWGMFLSYLFATDDALTIPRVYESAEHFNWATGGQYVDGHMSGREMHNNHRWNFDGVCVTGSYNVSSCKCGAVRRFMTHGRSFAEIASV